MNKRSFISFGLVFLLLVIVIPLWAFNKDGSESSSSEKVAASDDAARQLFQTNCGTCHTLDRGGTDAVVGPDLHERHAPAGPAAATTAVTATNARVMTAIEQGVGGGAMPAGILEGSNAQTVSNFVARVAGR